MQQDKPTLTQVGQFLFACVGQQLQYTQPCQCRAQPCTSAAWLTIRAEKLRDVHFWNSLRCTSVNVHTSSAFFFIALHANADDFCSKDVTFCVCMSWCPLTASQNYRISMTGKVSKDRPVQPQPIPTMVNPPVLVPSHSFGEVIPNIQLEPALTQLKAMTFHHNFVTWEKRLTIMKHCKCL